MTTPPSVSREVSLIFASNRTCSRLNASWHSCALYIIILVLDNRDVIVRFMCTCFCEQIMFALVGVLPVSILIWHMTQWIWWPALQAIKQGVEDGHYFSIAPSIVRDPSQKQVATSVPLDRLVLESDSPALGPVKGQTNTPLNLLQTVDCLADLLNCSKEHVIEVTTENALRLFPKLRDHIKL